uniref:PB1-like domain-containing protein n=1 Tax=Chenopodium quinoa TaxID=63459 RepID=A0A803MQT9_CHEQI
MWHGGVFETGNNGQLCYRNGEGRTFSIDPDELCSFYLVELVMKCARYDGRIKGFLYLVPGLSMVDGLRKVTDDESIRDMIQVAEKYRGVEVYVMHDDNDPIPFPPQLQASAKKNQPKTVMQKKLPINRGPQIRCSPRKKSQPLTINEPTQKAPDSSLKPKTDEFKKDAPTVELNKDAPTESVPTPPTNTLSNQSSFRVKYVINPSSPTATALPTLSFLIEPSNTQTDPVQSYEWEDSRPYSPIPINDLIPDYSTESDHEDPPYNPLVDKGKGVSSKPFFGEVYSDHSDEDIPQGVSM